MSDLEGVAVNQLINVARRRTAAAIARQGDPKGEAEGRIIRPVEPVKTTYNQYTKWFY
jgi:hypothetical protein